MESFYEYAFFVMIVTTIVVAMKTKDKVSKNIAVLASIFMLLATIPSSYFQPISTEMSYVYSVLFILGMVLMIVYVVRDFIKTITPKSK